MIDRELTDTQLSHMIIDWKNSIHYSSIIWLCRKAIAADRTLLATPAPAQPDPLHVANERGEGWRPIETAPTEEIVLLAGEFDFPGDWRIKCGYFSLDRDGWHVFGASWTPTHWMPLPPPPAAPKEKP